MRFATTTPFAAAWIAAADTVFVILPDVPRRLPEPPRERRGTRPMRVYRNQGSSGGTGDHGRESPCFPRVFNA